MPWKESEIAALKSLWGKRSASKIGLKIRKTKNAVIGKARRLGLERLQSPIRRKKVRLKKVRLKKASYKKYTVCKRGKCQWIFGDPIERCTTDEGKCLKPTIYRNDGRKSSYCLEHTKKSWRPAPKSKG